MRRNILPTVLKAYAFYKEVAANVLYSTESNPSFPRLKILRDLPRQSTDNKSPATLWLDGKMHEITLNGTPDGSSFQPIHPDLR